MLRMIYILKKKKIQLWKQVLKIKLSTLISKTNFYFVTEPNKETIVRSLQGKIYIILVKYV